MRLARVVAALVLVGAALFMPFPANIAQAAVADWTFLIYLDADNNLEPVGILDFLEMASVGSSAQVNIIVQFDRAVGFDALFGDWTTVKRFRVTQGITPTPANALVDLGELDMADPATLVDFVSWGVATYPARHYFLDLWDHGFGWPGVLQDGTGYMTTAELGTALAQVRSTLGRNLDIIGNDACRMTLEIMYELQPFVDYFVGSQKDEPADGWPYDTFLGAVVASPLMSPIDVGGALVSAYIASYEGTSPYSVTLSLVSSAALPGLVRRLAEFTSELNASVPLLAFEVLTAHTATERYEGNEEVDLYHFTENVVASVFQTRVHRLAERLQDAIRSAVIANEAWDNPTPENGVRAQHAHGLSIWFPTTLSDPAYSALALSRDTDWDGFLATWRGGTPVVVPTEADAVSVDRDDPPNGLLDTIEVTVTVPQNGTLGIDLHLSGPFIGSLSGGYVEGRDVRLVAGEASQ
ncbi:MAG: clostripain-related cysteine peptidase, partial [Candidatus Thermoplasmatota archaeon]